MALVEQVGVKNSSGTVIDPATSENQTLIVNAVEGQLIVKNVNSQFKDGFNSGTQPNTAIWTYVNPSANHIVTEGGNAFGSSYLRISLSPFDTNSEVTLTSIQKFNFPVRVGFGVSTSQRIIGQEVGLEVVGVDGSGNVTAVTPIVDQAMPASVTVAVANVLPIPFVTPHSFHGGDRVVIYGCLDSRLNAGPVIVTVVDSLTISVPVTLALGTYTSTGGYIHWQDPIGLASNGTSLLLENATVTNASFVTRRTGGSFRTTNEAIASTTATQGSVSPYTDAFLCAGNQELFLALEEANYRSYTPDGVATMSGLSKYNQSVSDETISYSIRIRARNTYSLTVPVARVVSITKTGTTTATVVTDIANGLTTSDFIQIYGALDQTNFPNLTTAVVVTGIISPTSFTCIIGTASSTSTVGGVVWRVQGSANAPGVIAGSIQSISQTSGIISVVNGVTWATPLPGEYYQLWGMQNGATSYDGAYKVLRVNTTTLELQGAVGVPDFGSIANTGGCGFKRTDVRLHFARRLDYTRVLTEIVGGRGNTTDLNNAVPVALTGGTVTTVSSVTGVTTLTTATTLQKVGATPVAAGTDWYFAQQCPIEELCWANNVRSLIT